MVATSQLAITQNSYGVRENDDVIITASRFVGSGASTLNGDLLLPPTAARDKQFLVGARFLFDIQGITGSVLAGGAGTIWAIRPYLNLTPRSGLNVGVSQNLALPAEINLPNTPSFPAAPLGNSLLEIVWNNSLIVPYESARVRYSLPLGRALAGSETLVGTVYLFTRRVPPSPQNTY
jgi:hypothetical protein